MTKQTNNEWEKEFFKFKERAEFISGDNTWHISYKIILPFIRQLVKELTGEVDNHLWENGEIKLQQPTKTNND